MWTILFILSSNQVYQSCACRWLVRNCNQNLKKNWAKENQPFFITYGFTRLIIFSDIWTFKRQIIKMFSELIAKKRQYYHTSIASGSHFYYSEIQKLIFSFSWLRKIVTAPQLILKRGGNEAGNRCSRWWWWTQKVMQSGFQMCVCVCVCGSVLVVRTDASVSWSTGLVGNKRADVQEVKERRVERKTGQERIWTKKKNMKKKSLQ